MSWDFTPLALPLFLSAFVSAGVALYTWRRRETAGGISLVVLASAAAIWATADAFTIMSPTLDQYMFWWDVSYIGIIAVPLAWLAFALEYTGHTAWTTKPRLALLAAIPVAALALVWTEPKHGLMWTVHGVARRDPFIFVDIERGPLFWVYTIQSYALVILGAVLLLSLLGHSYRHFRRRALALMMLTVVLPTGVNIIQALARVYDFAGIQVLDLTPYTFAVSTPALALAIFRFRVQDLAPVARDAVIEQIQDGIILLDPQFVVLDINAAGQRLLSRPDGGVIGMRLAALAPELMRVLNQARRVPGRYELASRHSGGTDSWHEVTLSTLRDAEGSQAGFAIALRDITERKRLEQRLAYQAQHDSLTGLANRALLEAEIRRRSHQASPARPLALAFFDLDGFKEVNDRFGHHSGDAALMRLAGRLLEAVNEDDVVARWGGDEFAVLGWLPATGAANVWAAKLLAACAERRIEAETTLLLSASVGVALAQTGDAAAQLIQVADDAMYRAKRAGKNRVHVVHDVAHAASDAA